MEAISSRSSSSIKKAASSVTEGMYTQHLSEEVTQAVQEAIPTSDPLDRPVRGRGGAVETREGVRENSRPVGMDWRLTCQAGRLVILDFLRDPDTFFPPSLPPSLPLPPGF